MISLSVIPKLETALMKRIFARAARVRTSIKPARLQRMVGLIALLAASTTQAHHDGDHASVAAMMDHFAHPVTITALVLAAGVAVIVRLRSQD